MRRFVFLALALPLLAVRAAPPATVALALESLRDQRSYSWEVINGDPGPVVQNVETRRGTVTTVQRNLAPNIKGTLDLAGDTLLRREWSDGMQLETLLTARGDFITKTPEGWLTTQEILTAQADERIKGGASARAVWLRRADRPEVPRPDQELAPLLKGDHKFEEVARDHYVVRLTLGERGEEDTSSQTTVTINLHLRNSTLRNYEVLIEGTRAMGRPRVRVPVSEQRLVVLSFAPVRRVDVPDEARAKLKPAAVTASPDAR